MQVTTDMTTIPLRALVLLISSLWSSVNPLGAQDAHILRLENDPDEAVFELVTRVRHTTVITLPADENILDFVVGDPEYWALMGSANVAFLKPAAEGAETNIALVCESGRIYSFLVAEDATVPPNLLVRFVGSGAGGGSLRRGADGGYQPGFVARSRVEGFQAMAEQAAADAEAVRALADTAIAEARREAARKITAFQSTYPTRIHFPYRLDDDAYGWPFMVEAMWTDAQFTYLRSLAQESPVLYEELDGESSLVPYDLMEDGLFIVRRVIGDGWLQVGDKAVRWRYRPPNPLEQP